jgi:hypothetical protein
MIDKEYLIVILGVYLQVDPCLLMVFLEALDITNSESQSFKGHREVLSTIVIKDYL